MTFTLENQTERRLELRWIDFDGKEKMSDQRESELLELLPKGGKFVGEKTFAGHVFQLRDIITRETIGYIYFEHGKKPIVTGKLTDRKSTRLNSSHSAKSRMPSSA